MNKLEVVSHLLPNTEVQYAWDSTSLGALKRCPRYYYYTIIAGWDSPEESVHLRFGIEYHRALENYDISRAKGVKHDDAVFDAVRALLISVGDWDSDHKTKNRKSLLRTVIWYLDKFKDDAASTVILANGKPAVEVSFRFALDWAPRGSNEPYLLCGHLDRVVEFNGEVFVMDRKTTTYNLGPWYFNQFDPNNQMTLYSLAGRVVLNSPVRGIIIDAAKIGEEVTDYKRDFTFRSPEIIDEWLGELKYWFSLAEQFAQNNYWPKNDTACDKYGGCPFRSVCSKNASVRQNFLDGNFVQKPVEERWNPLVPRG